MATIRKHLSQIWTTRGPEDDPRLTHSLGGSPVKDAAEDLFISCGYDLSVEVIGCEEMRDVS